MTQPSLDKIIEQIQFCIVDAKALQLKMLERLLSIALLEAHENKEKSGSGRSNGEYQAVSRIKPLQKAARFRRLAGQSSTKVTTSVSAAREVR